MVDSGGLTLTYLQEVSSEGGPLLIADAALAQNWRGIEGDKRSDYWTACQIFDGDRLQGGVLPVGAGQGMVWEMEGAGTADIFALDSTHMIIVRSWLDASLGGDEFETVERLGQLPLANGLGLGDFEITSGVLAILWATEDGRCIESLDIPRDGRPTGEMSSQSSGLLIRIPEGRYSCLHDFVQMDGGEARRCHIIRR